MVSKYYYSRLYDIDMESNTIKLKSINIHNHPTRLYI